jgi:folate-binding protein YgfZ
MELLALHALHQRFGARFGAWNGSEVVEDFGTPAAEYAACRSSAALFDLSHREILRVVGKDRVSFLQGMISNDVESLPVGDQMYAVLLTAKGSMICDARVLKRESDVLLELEAGRGSKAKATLERYIVSEDVEVVDSRHDFGVLALAGPRAEALSARFVDPAVQVLRDDVLGASARRLLIAADHLADVAERLLTGAAESGVQPAGMQVYEVVRVENRVPRYGIDMDEQTIPLEANLQRAISYTKGCYLGQEIIARATYRGHVNRLLQGLIVDGELPPPRTALLRDGKAVGFITSAVRPFDRGAVLALGYVHRDSCAAGTRLQVESGGIAQVAA